MFGTDYISLLAERRHDPTIDVYNLTPPAVGAQMVVVLKAFVEH